MNDFGNVIMSLRKGRGMSQPEFAKLLSKAVGSNITRSAVSMWELGQRIPKVDVIIKIAQYFNMDVNTLLNVANTSGISPDEEPPETSPEITLIARAGQKMTPDQRELMLKWAKLTFPEAFKDE